MTIIAANDTDRDGIKEFITHDQTQSKITLNTIGAYAGVPSITLISPQSSYIYTNQLHIPVTGRVPANTARLQIRGQDIEIQADGSFSADVTLEPTINIFEIIATNPEGKVGKQILTVTYTAPTALSLSITSPSDNITVNASVVTVIGTVSSASTRVTVNGVQAIISGSAFSAPGIVLQEGQNTITAIVQDYFEQTATASLTVTLLTKGTITGTITNASSGQALSGVTVTVNDSSGSHSVMTDAQGSYSLTEVAQGSYTAVFTLPGYAEKSVSGSISASQTRTQNVQLTPYPQLTIAISSPQDGAVVNSSPIAVTGTVTNNAQVTVNGISTSVSSGSFSRSISLTEGENTITAVATDSYGQTASTSITVTLLTKGTVSGTVTDSSTGQPLEGATVTVTDSESIIHTTFTDTAGQYAIPTVTPGQYTGIISKEDYDTYSFAGSITAGETVTVNGSITLQPPATNSLTAIPLTESSMAITWNTDQSSDSVISYGTTTAYGSVVSSPTMTINHSLTLTNLLVNTSYHFTVASSNSHGLSSSSIDSTFTTIGAPEIAGIIISSVTTTSATITWTTDQSSDSVVSYGTTTVYGSSVTNSTLTQSHTLTLADLTEHTMYYFTITSRNMYGMSSSSEDKTLSTRSTLFTATALGDYGNVTVMEVAGNYDALNPDDTINDLPRQEIAKEFLRSHPDDYDFMVVISNFDFTMPESEAKAFYSEVKNDTQGIGKPLFDNTSFYGSSGRLQGMIDMGNISYLGLSPLDSDKFDETLNLLAHEQMHRWGASVKFKNADGSLNTALLANDNAHWSYLLDTDGSVLLGNDWQNNGDGTFTSMSANKYLSPLDLYLMGLTDRTQVPPMLLIENAAIDPATLPQLGSTITGTAKTVTIDDIIAAEGERVPSAADSQKAFKVGYIFITEPNTFTGSETAGIENLRSAWAAKFANITGGKASISDVAPGITITIATPTNGSTVSKDSVTVRGIVSNTMNNETGVTVNGMSATVYGSQFIASNVSLAEGSNTITVTATDTAGNTATATVTVTANTSGNYITITSNIDSGTAPLEATLRIDGYASGTSPAISYTGPASVDLSNCTSYDSCKVKMTVEGVYYFTATGTGTDGNTSHDTTTITALNRTKIDDLLKAKWEGMKTALLSGDTEVAVNYFSQSSQDAYREQFNALAAHLPEIISDMGTITFIKNIEHIAEYDLRSVQGGEIYSFQLSFIRGSDGIWRIKGF